MWKMCKIGLGWWKKTRAEKKAREKKVQVNEDEDPKVVDALREGPERIGSYENC